MKKYTHGLPLLLFSSICFSPSAGAGAPEKALAGFEKRVDAYFRSEAGKPLKRAEKKPPLKKGRGNYVRAYSYSMIAFATRCLYLGEKLEEANAALVENAQHYIDNPKDIYDRDSFQWHSEIVLRLIEMYGSNGSVKKGLITPETEAIILKPISEYARCAWLEKAEIKKSKTWYYYGSENHNFMDLTIIWHFSKIAKDHPDYKDLPYSDGHKAKDFYEAYNRFFLEFARERAKKGVCAEIMSDGYNCTFIKGMYNFHDFGNEKVRKAAAMLLDLFWAYWAQEQIDGAVGGGKTRIYFYKGFKQNRSHGTAPLAWMYFGIGNQPKDVYGHDVAAALSTYQPSPVIADIALNAKERGRYEIIQRAQGLAKRGNSFPVATAKAPPTKFNLDGGGMLRYSYCDPSFILGTLMLDARPKDDYAGINAQNRWQGLVFANDARIVPIVLPKDTRVGWNTFWGVQSKGCLITMKNKFQKDGTDMLVWMSKEGLSKPLEKDGVVFVESPGAYAAVRVAKGGFKWMKGKFNTKRFIPENNTMVLKDDKAPVIIEVMSKKDIKSFEEFIKKVLSSKPEFKHTVLSYKSIYGDTLTLDTSSKKRPTINGKEIDLKPKKVYESPFLNADYDSGIVTIQKGKKKMVLDFNTFERK